MASDRKRPREDQFYRRGRVASHGYPEDIEQAATRKRGQLIVHGHTARAFNVIDAMAMGQEDYRDGKPAAKAGEFRKRVTRAESLRRLRPHAEAPEWLHEAYLCGYEGQVEGRAVA